MVMGWALLVAGVVALVALVWGIVEETREP